jgi:hypothetical protein
VKRCQRYHSNSQIEGTPKSGKSTFFKLLKILFQEPHTEEELDGYKSYIYRVLMHTINLCTNLIEDKKIAFQDDDINVCHSV